MSDMPREIQSNMLKQERNLKNSINYNLKQEKLADYLHKVTKKDKKDLLLFSNIYSQMKKEVNELKDSTNNFTKYSELNAWYYKNFIINIRIASLRSPPDFKGTRNVTINIGSTKNPMWRSFKDNNEKKVELIRPPELNSPVSTSDAFYKTLSHFKVTDVENNFLKSKNQFTGEKSAFNFYNIGNVSQIYVSLFNYF